MGLRCREPKFLACTSLV